MKLKWVGSVFPVLAGVVRRVHFERFNLGENSRGMSIPDRRHSVQMPVGRAGLACFRNSRAASVAGAARREAVNSANGCWGLLRFEMKGGTCTFWIDLRVKIRVQFSRTF